MLKEDFPPALFALGFALCSWFLFILLKPCDQRNGVIANANTILIRPCSYFLKVSR